MPSSHIPPSLQHTHKHVLKCPFNEWKKKGNARKRWKDEKREAVGALSSKLKLNLIVA